MDPRVFCRGDLDFIVTTVVCGATLSSCPCKSGGDLSSLVPVRVHHEDRGPFEVVSEVVIIVGFGDSFSVCSGICFS